MTERGDADVALADFERRGDAALYRLLAWAWRRFRVRRSRPVAASASTLALFRPEHAPVEQLVVALNQAFANGALETAERIASALAAHLEQGTSLGRLDLALLLDAWLMIGERDRAVSLAEAHRSELAKTDRGLAGLEALRLAPTSARLPSGKPNFFQLSRRIARGQLTGVELASALAPLGWRSHTLPDLNLLFFNATRHQEPERAERFMNRYFADYGLVTCTCRGGDTPTDDALSHFRFEPPRKERGPLVSIVVPARNAAHTIGYAIDSLLAQSYETLEVLVGDDASQDGTLELVLARYAEESRVRIFQSREAQGAYNLRNALAKQARGELVTFHDADDLALPQRIALQVGELRRHGTVACIGNGLRVRPNAEVVFFKDHSATRLSPVSLMLERRAFEALGYFRSARFGADHELHAKLLARHGERSVARLRLPLMLSLWSDASATRTPGTESLEDGYRSPARRAYSELVYARYSAKDATVTDERIDARLQASNNFGTPSELAEVSALSSRRGRARAAR